MTFKRPSWDEFFVEMLQVIRKRSTCTRAQHAALVVRENYPVAEGYNGSPTGTPHCTTAGCLVVAGHCKRSLHAEENALLQAAKQGASLKGGTIYVTGTPCIDCLKRIVQVGISTIVISDIEPYDNDEPVLTEFWNQLKEQIEVRVPNVSHNKGAGG